MQWNLGFQFVSGKLHVLELNHLADVVTFFFGARNEALRVAYIDVVENVKDGRLQTEYYSKLVKADVHGKDKVSIFASNV